MYIDIIMVLWYNGHVPKSQPKGTIVNGTTRREMLVTRLITSNTENPTYLMQIRLGYNWTTYTLSPYNHALLAGEIQNQQQVVRTVTLDDEENIISIEVGGLIFKPLKIIRQ